MILRVIYIPDRLVRLNLRYECWLSLFHCYRKMKHSLRNRLIRKRDRAKLINHYTTLYAAGVIYWPSTEPSIKRCTSVNKRKNSRSRWTVNNNIIRYPDGSNQFETGCQRENQLTDWGICGPQLLTVEQPSPDEREILLGQYSSPSLSPLISHT